MQRAQLTDDSMAQQEALLAEAAEHAKKAEDITPYFATAAASPPVSRSNESQQAWRGSWRLQRDDDGQVRYADVTPPRPAPCPRWGLGGSAGV